LARLAAVIPGLSLTGAGPAHFAVVDDPQSAHRLAWRARSTLDAGWRVIACRAVADSNALVIEDRTS
jgi:hypothetical protein